MVKRLQNVDFPVKEADLLHAAFPLQVLDGDIVALLVGNHTDCSKGAFANLLVNGFGVRSPHQLDAMPVRWVRPGAGRLWTVAAHNAPTMLDANAE